MLAAFAPAVAANDRPRARAANVIARNVRMKSSLKCMIVSRTTRAEVHKINIASLKKAEQRKYRRQTQEPRPKPGFSPLAGVFAYCCVGAGASGCGAGSRACVLPAGADATSLVHRSLNTTRLSGVYSLVRQVQGFAVATVGATA